MTLSMPAVDGLFDSRAALLLDFDGTVADTAPLHAEAFCQAFASYPFAIDYQRLAGMSTSDAVRAVFATNGAECSQDEVLELTARKQALVRALIADRLRPASGVAEFLDKAVAKDLRLGLVTSGSRGTVQLSLQVLGLRRLFACVICADDVRRAKPDPEGYRLALDQLDVSAPEALVIEDALPGFSASAAAGIDFVDITRTSWAHLTRLLA